MTQDTNLILRSNISCALSWLVNFIDNWHYLVLSPLINKPHANCSSHSPHRRHSSMTSESQSSPPSLGLGSVFWSITDDKCKKVDKSISHYNHQRLARRPKYGKEQHQNCSQPVHTSASWPHGRTRGGHFPPTECHDRQKSVSPSYSAVAVVSSLSWLDHRGIMGHSTGQVNARIQPHGSGALVYDDGIAKTCI